MCRLYISATGWQEDQASSTRSRARSRSVRARASSRSAARARFSASASAAFAVRNRSRASRRRFSAALSGRGAAGFCAAGFFPAGFFDGLRAGTMPGSSPKPDAVRSSCMRPRSSTGQRSGSSDATRSVCVAFSSVGALSFRRRKSRWTRSRARRCSAIASFRSAPFFPATAASCACRSRLPDWTSARTSEGSSCTSSFSAPAATVGFGSAAIAAASSGSFCFSDFERALRADVNSDSGSA